MADMDPKGQPGQAGAGSATEAQAATGTERATAAAKEAGREAQRQAGRLFGRARAFAKDHPGVALAVLAGMGAAFEVELAVGALVGVGATMLLTKKSGHEAREDLNRWVREGRDRLAHRLGLLESAVAEQKKDETAAATPPRT
jgi:hypothetical protein